MALPPRSEHFSKPTFPWRFGRGGGPATGRLPRPQNQTGKRRRDAQLTAPCRNYRAEEGHAKKWHGQARQCHQGTRATSSLDVRPFKRENSRYVNVMSIFLQYVWTSPGTSKQVFGWCRSLRPSPWPRHALTKAASPFGKSTKGRKGRPACEEIHHPQQQADRKTTGPRKQCHLTCAGLLHGNIHCAAKKRKDWFKL